MQGCTQIDLEIYPPPDLAIECDVTSKTTLEVYAAIGFCEVWIYRQQELKIYSFADGNYQENSVSRTFPNLPITILIPQLVQQVIAQGTSKMLRTLRSELK